MRGDDDLCDFSQHDGHPYYHVDPLAQIDHEYADFGTSLTINAEIKNEGVHEQLQNNLVEYLWAMKGKADGQID